MITLPTGYRHVAVARALLVATLLAMGLPLHAAEQSLRSLLPAIFSYVGRVG
jgi:hypothetical protein